MIPYWTLWKILEWVKRIEPVDGRMMNAYAEAAFTGQGREKTIVRLTRTLFPTLVLVADGKGAIDFQILSDPDHKSTDFYTRASDSQRKLCKRR